MKVLIIWIVLIIQFIYGQQTQAGIPFSQISGIDNNIHNVLLPSVYHEKLIEEDSNKKPGTPYRYGYKHKVHLTPNNSGTWEQLPNGGNIWTIQISSKGAYSISFEYENFFIPQGGKLFVMSPDFSMVYGAYSHLNNHDSGHFSTPHIKGDTAIIEYYQPPENNEIFSLTISEVIHDYRDIMNYFNENRDWECGVNVICEEETQYQGPINSVAFLDMGGFICSGAMVNNVRQDLTPYFLTAWHCIDGENPNSFRFYFNKIASSCENTWGSAGEYAYSSVLLADSDGISHAPETQSPGGDWALLRINDQIEEDWEVFYAGWDVTGNYPIISCGVHHPGGTPKKINFDDDTAYGAWWDNASHGLTHWQVNWDEGGSEGGSSGSPIFNERSQIVGVLTGGTGECGEGWPDLYGKLEYGWKWEMETDHRMIDWLDPDYTGTLVIDGTYEIVTGITGDLNDDNEINILDIIQLANLILSNNYTENADLNNDGNLSILDIISLVNIILNN
tara:strand:+ start:302 stop:1813 length:1512 start_codon:yes stop_codon:yes gene_type:complete